MSHEKPAQLRISICTGRPANLLQKYYPQLSYFVGNNNTVYGAIVTGWSHVAVPWLLSLNVNVLVLVNVLMNMRMCP